MKFIKSYFRRRVLWAGEKSGDSFQTKTKPNEWKDETEWAKQLRTDFSDFFKKRLDPTYTDWTVLTIEMSSSPSSSQRLPLNITTSDEWKDLEK